MDIKNIKEQFVKGIVSEDIKSETINDKVFIPEVVVEKDGFIYEEKFLKIVMKQKSEDKWEYSFFKLPDSYDDTNYTTECRSEMKISCAPFLATNPWTVHRYKDISFVHSLKTLYSATEEEYVNHLNKITERILNKVDEYNNKKIKITDVNGAKELLLSSETQVQKAKRLLQEAKEAEKEAKRLAKEEEKENKLSVKAKIIQFSDSIELFKDQNGAPCVRYIDGDKAKIYSIFSKDFSEYLCSVYYDKYGDVPTDQEIKSALSVFSVKAKRGEQCNLAMRSCWYQGALWHDLGDWTAVKITSDGWEVVQDVPKIFRHYNNYDSTVEDTTKLKPEIGDINLLKKFISYDKIQYILYISKLVTSYIPEIQHPAVSISGKSGSKKTTSGRIIPECVDNRKGGKVKNVIDFPDDPKELAKILSNHWAVCFDNISNINTKQSDIICKYVTGANIEERELYTNNETYSTSYQGTAVLTAIDELIKKADALERTIGFSQEKQSDETRIDDDIFWADFNQAKPAIISGIFNILSEAMKIKDEIKLERTPRMASFVKWGIAISMKLGYTKEDFLEAYSISSLKLNEKLINTNLVCSMIVNFMSDKKEWTGTTSDLLKVLREVSVTMSIDMHSDGFPKEPVWLGRKISEFENNLSIYGIKIVETNKSKREYKITNNRKLEKSLFKDDFNLQFVNNLANKTTDEPVKTNCSECGKPMTNFNPEFGEFVTCQSCESKKFKKEYIIRPCFKCGKETYNRTHSIIEGEYICSECEPIMDIPENEESEEIIENIPGLDEYLEQQEEEHKIMKELDNDIYIPEEIC